MVVVVFEECEEVLCEVVFVEIGQCVDDFEIECDIVVECVWVEVYLDVVGVYVCVEEVVVEYLCEEDFDVFVCEFFDVDVG